MLETERAGDTSCASFAFRCMSSIGDGPLRILKPATERNPTKGRHSFRWIGAPDLGSNNLRKTDREGEMFEALCEQKNLLSSTDLAHCLRKRLEVSRVLFHRPRIIPEFTETNYVFGHARTGDIGSANTPRYSPSIRPPHCSSNAGRRLGLYHSLARNLRSRWY